MIAGAVVGLAVGTIIYFGTEKDWDGDGKTLSDKYIDEHANALGTFP